MKFKAGDEVIRIEASNWSRSKGMLVDKIYTVEKLNENATKEDIKIGHNDVYIKEFSGTFDSKYFAKVTKLHKALM